MSHLPKLVALQTELDQYKQREILYQQRLAVVEGGGERQFSDAAVNSSLVDVDNQVD